LKSLQQPLYNMNLHKRYATIHMKKYLIDAIGYIEKRINKESIQSKYSRVEGDNL